MRRNFDADEQRASQALKLDRREEPPKTPPEGGALLYTFDAGDVTVLEGRTKDPLSHRNPREEGHDDESRSMQDPGAPRYP